MNKKKTVSADIGTLEQLLRNDEGCAATILPDGTVLIDEEKRQARRGELITKAIKLGGTY